MVLSLVATNIQLGLLLHATVMTIWFAIAPPPSAALEIQKELAVQRKNTLNFSFPARTFRSRVEDPHYDAGAT
jgi:hypothetical protein